MIQKLNPEFKGRQGQFGKWKRWMIRETHATKMQHFLMVISENQDKEPLFLPIQV